MATELGTAYVQIIPSAQGVEKNLADLFDGPAKETGRSAGETIASGLGNGLKTAGQVAGIALGATTAAIGTVTSALMSGVNATADYGDNVDKMSQKLGISSTAYQEWDQVLQHSGTSMQSMGSTFKTLANAAQDASDDQVAAFERLGLSMDDVASMSTEDLFGAVITGLQGMEEGTERTALATDLLGRGALEMGALLNTSAEDTQAMIDRAHELGIVMSEEDVKAAAAYKDAMQDMQGAMQGVVRELTGNFMPSFTTVMNGIADLASGNTEEGVAQIVEGLSGIGDQLIAAVPTVSSAIGQFFAQVAPAIVQEAPGLISAMGEAVITIGQTLATQLPTLVITAAPALAEVAMGLITNLTTAIGAALPTLIPAATQAVVTIVQGLIDALPQMLEAASALVTGLANGILAALPILIAALPDIILGIIDFLLGAIPEIIQTGITLLGALVDALPDVISAVVAALPELLEGIVNGLLEHIPEIMQAGIDLLVALIDALPEIIVTIVNALPDLIDGIITGLLDHIPEMIDAGLQLFVAILENTPEIISQLVSKLPEIIEALLTALIGLASKFLEVGVAIVNGIWEGIKSMWASLVEWFSGLWDSLVGGVKDFLGIHSPSTVFAEIGENMALGLGEGFTDAMTDVRREIEGDMQLTSAISADVRSDYGGFEPAGYEVFNVTIDAASVREFNDIVNLAKNQRRLGRMVTA